MSLVDTAEITLEVETPESDCIWDCNIEPLCTKSVYRLQGKLLVQVSDMIFQKAVAHRIS
jgi:hypothetical protein